MKDVMGIIYTGEKDSFLRELTLQRAIAATGKKIPLRVFVVAN